MPQKVGEKAKKHREKRQKRNKYEDIRRLRVLVKQERSTMLWPSDIYLEYLFLQSNSGLHKQTSMQRVRSGKTHIPPLVVRQCKCSLHNAG